MHAIWTEILQRISQLSWTITKEWEGYTIQVDIAFRDIRPAQAKTGRIIPQVNEEYGYEDHYPKWAKTYPERALWIGNLINLVLDPCLIFGQGPLPELGVGFVEVGPGFVIIVPGPSRIDSSTVAAGGSHRGGRSRCRGP